MKKDYRHIIALIVFAQLYFGLQVSNAQKIDAFAGVSISPREGVVRQPYKVIITVHSSTWFSKPLQFANLRIDNAFIIPFTRTVSSINYINNKKYATLSFYYLVFPYNTGNLEIPELEISTSIPPEGGSKGEPITIRTKAQKIKVKPVPSSKTEQVWMVAKNITIKESWDKPLDKLKVGDVIERVITISANGTLPSLILPLEITKPELASIYPKEPVLQDKRNKDDVNGVRIEKYAYLFEEETEISIPEETILWWNPDTKKVFQRTIPGKKLSIAANPDLDIMESLKDSLLAMSAPVDLQTEEKTFPWLRTGFLVLVLLLLAYFGTKAFQKIRESMKRKQADYLQSEAYFFSRVNQALNKGSAADFIRKLYIWFDNARNPEQYATIYSFLNKEDKILLEGILQNIDSKLNIEQKKKLELFSINLRHKVSNPELKSEHASRLNPV